MGAVKERESGRDISLGDRCSKVAFDWACKSFQNRKGRPGALVGGLESSYSNVIDFGSVQIAMASDGIGTKIEIAERMGIYDTLGFDLVAMVVDDLVCNGAEPTSLSNVLDVDFLDEGIVQDLMKGLYEAATSANISVTGGEIAELGSRIGGYGKRMHFNWCATGIGVLQSSDVIRNGQSIRPGHTIIALKSCGLRSNGFSLARGILQKGFGDLWHEQAYSSEKTWGQILLTPSLIYAPFLLKIQRMGIPLHAVVHVTGGGIAGNLKRVLRKNSLGAELSNLFAPFPFMLELQRMGELDEEEVYEKWNMGNGMLLIVEDSDSTEVLRLLAAQKIEAKVAGVVCDDDRIILHSKACIPKKLQD